MVEFWTRVPNKWIARGAEVVSDNRGSCPSGATGGVTMRIEATQLNTYTEEGDDSLGQVVEFMLPDLSEWMSWSGSATVLPACQLKTPAPVPS